MRNMTDVALEPDAKSEFYLRTIRQACAATLPISSKRSERKFTDRDIQRTLAKGMDVAKVGKVDVRFADQETVHDPPRTFCGTSPG